MTIYAGEVIDSTNSDFPFIAVITDDAGMVVGEFSVRTVADGEAKIMEVLKMLEDEAAKAQKVE